MASALETGTVTKRAMDLILTVCSQEKIMSGFIKVGTKLPPWHISNSIEWSGGNFDMQGALTDHLAGFGLTWSLNGANQIEVA